MDYIDHLEERTFVLNELGVGVREVLTNYGDVLSGPEPQQRPQQQQQQQQQMNSRAIRVVRCRLTSRVIVELVNWVLFKDLHGIGMLTDGRECVCKAACGLFCTNWP